MQGSPSPFFSFVFQLQGKNNPIQSRNNKGNVSDHSDTKAQMLQVISSSSQFSIFFQYFYFLYSLQLFIDFVIIKTCFHLIFLNIFTFEGTILLFLSIGIQNKTIHQQKIFKNCCINEERNTFTYFAWECKCSSLFIRKPDYVSNIRILNLSNSTSKYLKEVQGEKDICAVMIP